MKIDVDMDVLRETNEMHLFEKQSQKRNWQVMSKISQARCQKFLIMSTTLRMKKQKPLLQNLIYFSSIYHLCKLTV